VLLLVAALGAGLALGVLGVLSLTGGAREHASDLTLPPSAQPLTGAAASPASTLSRGDGATLAISSFPSGAMVLLDSKLVGTTPLSLDDLASGTYTVTVAERGYAVLDTVVTVAPAQLVSLLLPLRSRSSLVAPWGETPAVPDSGALALAPALDPAASSGTGRLSVVVRPWGTIVLDGAVAARETDVRYEAAVAAGPHRVRAEHPVLGSREVVVSVGAGETAEVVIDLADRPAAALAAPANDEPEHDE
jgi:hypothetical protein